MAEIGTDGGVRLGAIDPVAGAAAIAQEGFTARRRPRLLRAAPGASSQASNSDGSMATAENAISACDVPQNSAQGAAEGSGLGGKQRKPVGAAGNHVHLAAECRYPERVDDVVAARANSTRLPTGSLTSLAAWTRLPSGRR